MVKHNNMLPNVHLRKHWSRFVKTWFNQPARKHRRAITRKEKQAASYPRPLEKLRPLVHAQTRKYSSKVRYGRGFTLQEIRAAGLTPQFARTVGIAVDHRRQDTNEETLQVNKQRLETYKSKLILFPRKEAKVKKGCINDATAEQLKSPNAEHQNKAKHLVAKIAMKRREKAVKLAKEALATKIFMKLRQARVNQRCKGKREKRAREQAEKYAAGPSKREGKE
eukprot:CAMPEP_0202961986 /NCGR_PEP_ID=MMETSP1396-20130829/6081_1 /ASSEMBLY_ACC=CAM_ASM_000872 /TAXON_ID= /ORGANISM="Pseudokeronopsis sp., Strain Brazil" /LENGTH=222 /DNA_ID=CAMNT_0049682245 /DNA_START=53 /DNA_END=721 /DNA_ORIENTATION=-